MHMKDIFPELRSMDIANLLRELKEEKKIMHVGVKEVSDTGGWLKLHLKGLFLDCKGFNHPCSVGLLPGQNK